MNTPRPARWLLRLLVQADRLDDVLGDLEEVHARRRRGGPALAWAATVAEAGVVGGALLWIRLRSAAWPDLRHAVAATDVRLALRLMRRQPIVTLTAGVALALGIGLATVGFGFAEALLDSRLPFEGGDRFVRIDVVQEPEHTPARLRPDDYQVLATGTPLLEHLGALSMSHAYATLPSGATDIVTTAGLTPSSLRLLPYAPLRGRLFVPADGRAGAEPVVMLREAYWRRALGAADDVVGATIEVGGVSRTIVGVAPDQFEFPNTPDLWTPIDEGFLTGRAEPVDGARLFGVLAPGRSLASAREAVATLSARLAPAPGATGPLRVELVGFTDVGPQGVPLALAALAAVLAVLVVVAANVGNLVLARSFTRTRELALRAALGASRERLVCQISLEVLVIGAVAAVVGSAAAQAVLRQFNAIDEIPFWVDFSGGPRTPFLVAGATLLATAVAGAWPALKATRRDLVGAMQGGDGRTSDVRFGRVAGAMVVTQIAVSVVMLHGAIVVAQGFAAYAGAELGLPRDVLTAGLSLEGHRDEDTGHAPSPGIRAIEEIARVQPGVRAAGITTALPRHSPPARLVEVETAAGEAPHAPMAAPAAAVTAGYFAALDTAPLGGRLFDDADYAEGAAAVAVVNAPFVRRFLAGGSPIGRRFRTVDGAAPGPWLSIVGVVPDLGLSVGDPALAAGYYTPLDLAGDGEGRFVYLAVRTDGDPLPLAMPLGRALNERDPALVLNRPERLEDVGSEDRTFFVWFSTALVGLGLATLVLALAGVYAMMALIVARRTREIGIRVALGAPGSRIVATIVGRAAAQVALGGGVGAMLAVASLAGRGQLVMSRLGDGGRWTLPLVLGLLVAAGLAATWVPLRRALGVQPAEALRAE
ncbi:MAG: ABC transporter permease [Vicinamibacterales bacterium]